MLSIGILGRGSFGQFINRLANQYAPDTTRKVYDPYSSSIYDAALKEVCNCDVVFLAVPMSVFEDTIQQCASLFGPQTIVVDVCTVKVHPLECLQKYLSNQPYLSTHPMFGPYSYTKQGSLKDLRLVLCDHTLETKQYEKIIGLTTLLQLTVVECTADQHDQMLAKSLFLTHYMTQIVVEARLENTEIDTISFGNLMDVVASVRNDTELFHDVRKFNPYCKQLVEDFSAAKKNIDEKLGIK